MAGGYKFVYFFIGAKFFILLEIEDINPRVCDAYLAMDRPIPPNRVYARACVCMGVCVRVYVRVGAGTGERACMRVWGRW